jgi:hypothetical protein
MAHDDLTTAAASFRRDPDFTTRRTWREALRLGALIGLPYGVVPAAVVLEVAPHLGLLRPGVLSFVLSFCVFTGLARAPHRAVIWIVAGALSGLLVAFAVGATVWTLTQSLT